MVAVNFCVMMVAPWVSDLLLVVVGCWRGVWVAGMGCGVWVCGSSTWGVGRRHGTSFAMAHQSKLLGGVGHGF